MVSPRRISAASLLLFLSAVLLSSDVASGHGLASIELASRQMQPLENYVEYIQWIRSARQGISAQTFEEVNQTAG